ncbi:hypothetical protein CONPUDRAFT_106280 [Coniophora puteana RWD-64-598 SS2]|uniref:DUF7587 domain-containing protein n=1 Tax=Coniophora puteana (strain RWD-64-598) TaxID=741705 RepID=A0A5M3MLV6_CONPW|nr:uncharacterized protein CONPUDRAFT_106280 [Coniophora puteana RWD-64-598 SS2]EIW79645.1 hypothetical protein CONPUDRAFT_106280 [Coniophora puteana RWD-64-598 SS2]
MTTLSTLSVDSLPRHGSQKSPSPLTPLPQHGFGAECCFDGLIERNPFLFRVYTPKSHARPESEPFFVGQKYNSSYSDAPETLESPSGASVAELSTYRDVVQHMDWTQRHMSPYISSSFSFTWAIWEAARRYRHGVKHDIHIAVIDARALEGRAATALELLRKSDPSDRHADHWKWYRFAQESQDVLVYGSVPRSAVIATVPLLSLVEKLPSYFRSDKEHNSLFPFDSLSWNTMDRKASFRQFCQDMSNQFLSLSQEVRMREATSGSLKLAMAFLRPWFHHTIAEDFHKATSTVARLALIVAQWPAQWWSREHSQIRDVLRQMIEAIAEEIRQKHQTDSVKEVARLQGIVSELERLLEDYESTEGELSDSSTEVDVEELDSLSEMGKCIDFSLAKHESHILSPIIEEMDSDEEDVDLSASDMTLVAEPMFIPTLKVEKPTEEDNKQGCEVEVQTEPFEPKQTESKAVSPVTAQPSEALSIALVKHEQKQEPEVQEIHLHHYHRCRSASLVETAGCIITSLVVGAFITLAVVNSQRRTLIYVT